VTRFSAPRDVLPAVRTGSGYGLLRFLITLLHGVAFVAALLWFAAMLIARLEREQSGQDAPLGAGNDFLEALWTLCQQATAGDLVLVGFALPCIVAARQAALLLIDIADAQLLQAGRALERGDEPPR
jgi:hypothetical protein